jgi:hypothetical protein
MTMRNEFQVHMLNDTGIVLATELGGIFSEALDKFDALIAANPPNPENKAAAGEVARCRAIVITKLQEASFFAKRAIAVNPANQKDVA